MIAGAQQFFNSRNIAACSLMALASLICAQNLAFYLTFSFNLYVALLVFPFVMRINRHDHSHRYGWFSLLFFCLYPVLKIQLCFFFGFAFFVMFVIESYIGRLNSLPVFLLTVISPLSIYLFEIIGFPVRLQLTEWAASMLGNVFPDVSYQGNIILLSGQSFSIDRECAGLRMTITSFLVCIAWIAFYEKRNRASINVFITSGLLFLVALLIILCNLFRIIALVVFQSPPETVSHEVIGIISLAFCVFLPLWLATFLAFRYYGKKTVAVSKPTVVSPAVRWIFILSIFPVMAYLNFNREDYQKTKEDVAIKSIFIPGFEREVLATGVVKFTNDSSLVYVKPSLAFYGADHTPIMCWKGSGYEFTKENVVQNGDGKVYFAELKTDTGKLYTAWWYDNGNYKTTDQLDWRWRMLKGEEPFRIVNVTCASYHEVMETSKKLMNRNLFQPGEMKQSVLSSNTSLPSPP